MGIAAAELFRLMYREEQEKAGRRGWPAEPSAPNDAAAARSILSRNLFGADIDPFVLRLARLALGAHLGIGAAASACNLIAADALRSNLLPRHGVWPSRFDVIVTNPPYLAARNLPKDRVRELKQLFPRGRADGCGCFIDRCIDLLSDGGRMGLLSMQTFMFTSSFEALRQRLAEATAVESIAHFGPGLFGVGNPGTLQTVAFTAQRGQSPDGCVDQQIDIFRLVDEQGPAAKRQRLEEMLAAAKSETSTGRFRVRQASFAAIPRLAWAYWLAEADRDAFHRLPRLKAIAPPRQGLATTDNARFVRYWWEVTALGVEPVAVATEGRWRPYVKGGRFRRWHESPRHRVNWEADGREIKAEIVRRYPYLKGAWEWVAKNAAYYGREGLTYSYLTSGRFSAPARCRSDFRCGRIGPVPRRSPRGAGPSGGPELIGGRAPASGDQPHRELPGRRRGRASRPRVVLRRAVRRGRRGDPGSARAGRARRNNPGVLRPASVGGCPRLGREPTRSPCPAGAPTLTLKSAPSTASRRRRPAPRRPL